MHLHSIRTTQWEAVPPFYKWLESDKNPDVWRQLIYLNATSTCDESPAFWGTITKRSTKRRPVLCLIIDPDDCGTV